MDNNELVELEKLINKLQQHEEIIIQLLKIIASTNKKVVELSNNQGSQQNLFMLN